MIGNPWTVFNNYESTVILIWCIKERLVIFTRFDVIHTILDLKGTKAFRFFLRCKTSTYIPSYTYLSESRKGQTSGTGGVEGRSFASAMMCSKVMSVWVHTSTTWISWGGPWGRPLGVRLMTCTTTGSLAARKVSTVSSWLDLDSSLPLTWGWQGYYWIHFDSNMVKYMLYLAFFPFLLEKYLMGVDLLWDQHNPSKPLLILHWKPTHC